jgi:ribose-phosphate pyrophosphokinase
MLAKHFKERNVPNLVVAATDVGGGKHARNTARFLDAPIAIAEKMRIGNEDRVEAINLIGDVQGKNVLIVDDEIGTGGTVVATANTLVDHGAKDIYCYATHAIYAGSATQVLEQSPIKEIVVTDTLPLSEEARGTKTKTVSVASLLGEAIHRIHSGLSVGAMFDQ